MEIPKKEGILCHQIYCSIPDSFQQNGNKPHQKAANTLYTVQCTARSTHYEFSLSNTGMLLSFMFCFVFTSWFLFNGTFFLGAALFIYNHAAVVGRPFSSFSSTSSFPPYFFFSPPLLPTSNDGFEYFMMFHGGLQCSTWDSTRDYRYAKLYYFCKWFNSKVHS